MAEQVFLASPQATSGRRVIASPFQFLVTGEDNLRITAWNSATGTTLLLTGRMLGEDGTPKPLTQRLSPTSDRLPNVALLSLGTGFVLNLTVEVSSSIVRVGQCYVQIELVRGLSGALTSLGTLAAGYVAQANALAWPGSPIVGPLDGTGYVRIITGTAPAAGGECFETTPLHARWQLHSFVASLVTNAAAGNRNAILFADDAIARTRFASRAPYTQTAAQGFPYHWSPALPIEAMTPVGVVVGGLPWPNKLIEGTTLRTATVGLAGGDQWTAPTYQVEEWIDIWGA